MRLQNVVVVVVGWTPCGVWNNGFIEGPSLVADACNNETHAIRVRFMGNSLVAWHEPGVSHTLFVICFENRFMVILKFQQHNFATTLVIKNKSISIPFFTCLTWIVYKAIVSPTSHKLHLNPIRPHTRTTTTTATATATKTALIR